MIITILSPTACFFRSTILIPMKTAIDIVEFINCKTLKDTTFDSIFIWLGKPIDTASLLIPPRNYFSCSFFFLWSIEVTTENTRSHRRKGKRMIDT